MKKVDDLNVLDCDCLLLCSHVFNGKSVKYYQMKAVKLGETHSGKIKLLVFGERFFKNDDKKQIRYVNGNRVTELKVL